MDLVSKHQKIRIALTTLSLLLEKVKIKNVGKKMTSRMKTIQLSDVTYSIQTVMIFVIYYLRMYYKYFNELLNLVGLLI